MNKKYLLIGLVVVVGGLYLVSGYMPGLFDGLKEGAFNALTGLISGGEVK